MNDSLHVVNSIMCLYLHNHDGIIMLIWPEWYVTYAVCFDAEDNRSPETISRYVCWMTCWCPFTNKLYNTHSGVPPPLKSVPLHEVGTKPLSQGPHLASSSVIVEKEPLFSNPGTTMKGILWILINCILCSWPIPHSLIWCIMFKRLDRNSQKRRAVICKMKSSRRIIL